MRYSLLRPIGIPALTFMIATSCVHAQCDEQGVHAADAAIGDYFGEVTIVDGDRALLTAQFDDGAGGFSGSAYIFERQGTGPWQELLKLEPSDGGWPESNFGYSADLEADRIIIGAPGDSDYGSRSGAVYVYERNASGVWRETAKITASDAAPGATFGLAVALRGDTMLISGGGAAYLFRNDGGAWVEMTTLNDPAHQASDSFGWRVDLSDTDAVVSVPGDDDLGTDTGSVFIFDIADGNWLGTYQHVYASDPAPGAQYGTAVAIDGTRLAVGATGDSRVGTRTGAAYVLDQNANGVWSEHAKLVADDGSAYDDLGWRISVAGDLIAVTAPSIGYQSNQQETGRAYLFRRSGGLWAQVGRVTSPTAGSTDQFGSGCSTDGQSLVLGANLDDDFGRDAGSAFFYALDCGPTLTADGTCPAGGPIRVEWTRATPSAQIALIFALNQGSFVIPGGYACAGTGLGLGNAQIQVAYQGPSGATGAKVLNANAGPGACGGYLQLLDISNCQTSNVVQIN